MDRHDPGIAAVLSFLFNGLGQLYNGQLVKGLLIMFISLCQMLLVIIGTAFIGFFLFGYVYFRLQLTAGLVLLAIGISAIAALGIYNIFDAYNVAKEKASRNGPEGDR